MILVDPLTGSKELLPIIQRLGYPAQLSKLPYGDFAFDGNGPNGPISVGVERKSLHDMLQCIDDARYAGSQRGGMKILYNISFLAMEGLFKPHEPEGYLMEGFRGGQGWGPCRYRSRQTLYSKLYRYLISVSLAGVIITHSRDMYQTAFNIGEIYQYFQEKWDDHTSMQKTQVFPLYEVGGRPSLTRRWGAQIDGIGVKLSSDAERLFHTPIELGLGGMDRDTRDELYNTFAEGVERDWASIQGLSVTSAKRIVKEIWGRA